MKAVFTYITFAVLVSGNVPSVTPGFLYPASVFYKLLLTKSRFRDFTSENTWAQDTQGVAVMLKGSLESNLSERKSEHIIKRRNTVQGGSVPAMAGKEMDTEAKLPGGLQHPIQHGHSQLPE